MKPWITLITCLMLGLSPLSAQVTYTKDIAPIIYDNCTKCHRPGEIGPMPLTNYNEVKAWGAMIEYVTEINYMPPWKTDRSFSTFQDERYLTDQEKKKIKDWVSAGMPQGNPIHEPPPPIFPTGSQIGEPDLVLSFAEAFHHQGNNEDQYQNFVLPTGLTQDKILKAIELRPGNSRIVHHALFAMDTSGNAQILDNLSPNTYGYDGFGGFNVNVADNFPGYVPGNRSFLYPEAIGQKMYAGSDLLIQMHYAPSSAPESDSSTVNIFFADSSEQIDRQVMIAIMHPFSSATTLLNGPFIIPPDQVKTFHGVLDIPIDVSLMGLGPHMHLLGKDWTVYAVSPSGDTTNLIRIPDWDFNWQGIYFYKEFQILEAGSVIHAFATYDNTSSNPLNPNFPPKRVRWGEGTADEMYYLPFLFVPTLPGDDTMSLEVALPEPGGLRGAGKDYLVNLKAYATDTTFGSSSPTSTQDLILPQDKFYPVFPNPMNGPVNLGFSLSAPQRLNLSLYDLDGKLVDHIFENRFFTLGHHKAVLQSQQYSSGIYFLTLRGEDFNQSQKIVIR